MIKYTSYVALISTSLLIAGCGGGDSSSSSAENLTYNGSTTAVTINDQASADTVAAYAASVATSTSLLDGTGVPVGVSVTSTDTSTSKPGLSILSKIAKKYADLVLSSERNTESLTGFSDTQTIQCSGGGSQSEVATYSDPTQDTVGDSYTITYNNCIENNTTATGSIKTVLQAFNYATNEFTISFSFNNFKATEPTGDYAWLNGGYVASINFGDGISTDMQFAISGTSITVEQRLNNVVDSTLMTNFSFVDSLSPTNDLSFDHDLTIASTRLGGSVDIETVDAFVIYNGDNFPSKGQVIAKANNNRFVKLTAVDNTTATIEYDFDGNGIYGDNGEPAIKTVYWTDL